MLFRFNLQITEKDYLEYNKFHMLKSHYGKRQLASTRFTFALLGGFITLLALIDGKFSVRAVLTAIPLVAVTAIVAVCFPYFMAHSLKSTIKNLKKQGRLPYTPASVMEVYEDRIAEYTETAREERGIETVERVSVVDGKAVYLHLNSAAAHILPIGVFESQEQYVCFIDFLKSKCENVDFY